MRCLRGTSLCSAVTVARGFQCGQGSGMRKAPGMEQKGGMLLRPRWPILETEAVFILWLKMQACRAL